MSLSSITRYADQPLVINNLQKALPFVLTSGGVVAGSVAVMKEKKSKLKEAAIKNAIVLSSTILTSLITTRGLRINNKKILKGLMPTEKTAKLLKKHKTAIEKYLQNETKLPDNVKNILEKVKSRALKPSEIKDLIEGTIDNLNRKELFNTLFKSNEKLTSDNIFNDMKRLPLYGAYAIGSGVIGGLIADKITKTSSKENTANMLKEACYQYFANIFLCIVGAGTALSALECLERKGIVKNVTPTKKMATVLAGIIGVGVIFGSVGANLIGKKIINPLFGIKDTPENEKNIYSERKPEIWDLCIHVDDLATAGIYSGFKWIEAILPAFYVFAGYRAGMGHRNNKKAKK